MASKRRLRRKACGNKIRYGNVADALPHATRLRLNVYKCPHCHSFHAGHQPKKIREIVAARRGA